LEKFGDVASIREYCDHRGCPHPQHGMRKGIVRPTRGCRRPPFALASLRAWPAPEPPR
jgi:hypothetical protein